MNIGIIVHSQTGHTKSVAEKVREKLSQAGHTVEMEEVVARGEVSPGTRNIELESNPSVEGYEGIVFASPVQAFSLAPTMKAYLPQVDSLQGKKVACFVTKHLPGKWTGGNNAIRRMRRVCKQKGAEVVGSGIIIWSSKNREEMIETTVEKVTSVFL